MRKNCLVHSISIIIICLFLLVVVSINYYYCILDKKAIRAIELI